ncbi:MAG: hypothetical protein ACLUE8_10585 [Lachnospiraceae bacterium]
MALIVWRSFRWYRKDRRQYKKRLRLLPDAGYVGELVTIRGNAQLPTGTILPVPWEGVLSAPERSGCDIFLPVPGVAQAVAGSPMTGRAEARLGLPTTARTSAGEATRPRTGRGENLSMHHGSRLYVRGRGKDLRLRMFAGFEDRRTGPCAAGRAAARRRATGGSSSRHDAGTIPALAAAVHDAGRSAADDAASRPISSG